MGQHRLAPEAEAELDNIWYYIARESGSLEIADRFVDSLTATFLLLASHPYIGRRRDDLRPGLRSFPMGNYLIVYRVEEGKNVLILHVMHGRRDIDALFHP